MVDLWIPPPKPALILPDRKIKSKAATLTIPPIGRRNTALAYANATLVHTAFVSPGSPATSFNFGTVNLGNTSGTSLVAVCVSAVKTNGAVPIGLASSTIGGSAFDTRLEAQTGAGSLAITAAICLETIAANSANLTIVTSTNCIFVWAGVYRLNNLTSATPDDSIVAGALSTTTSGQLDTVNPGLLLLCVGNLGSSLTDITGVNTEDFVSLTDPGFGIGHSNQLATQSNRTVSGSCGANPISLAAYSWH